MIRNQLFARKSLETLQAEAGETRLRRVLGPVSLTALGVGAIIGAGIFVITGRVAAEDAGPAVVLSYVFAGFGCLFAALCYAEFASMAPVAGSAYTYAYATLGELFAWIIGWDLILEYAMACACVASSWSEYLNALLVNLFGPEAHLPDFVTMDPWTYGGFSFNLPALLITLIVTGVLIVGIRESATTNAILVIIKVGVVLFVIGVGIVYVQPRNWSEVPVADRLLPEEKLIPDTVKDYVKDVKEEKNLSRTEAKDLEKRLKEQTLGVYKIEHRKEVAERLLRENMHTAEEARLMVQEAEEKYRNKLPQTDDDKKMVTAVLNKVREDAPAQTTKKWGLLGLVGLNKYLTTVDDKVRSPYMPYGLAGIIFGAAIVFFAYIGFDAISTQSEEARLPQRDVPIAILASLVLCTALYIGVAGVITGMLRYPDISTEAAVAAAFTQRGINWAALVISIGALAGMTSVLLITFLSQARIFLAMSRDGLLPPSIFAAIHPRFRTPHRSTLLTGCVISIVAAVTPIKKLEEMVNIGTLMAFVIVCAAVILLRIRRPNVTRPFRTPFLFLFGPLGILVNLVMMLFLPLDTWIRLVVWLVVGLVIYFSYGFWNSTVGQQLRGLLPAFSFADGDGLSDKHSQQPGSEAIRPRKDQIHDKM
jgi:APA family basic amino acid/polyamine antiporter